MTGHCMKKYEIHEKTKSLPCLCLCLCQLSEGSQVSTKALWVCSALWRRCWNQKWFTNWVSDNVTFWAVFYYFSWDVKSAIARTGWRNPQTINISTIHQDQNHSQIFKIFKLEGEALKINHFYFSQIWSFLCMWFWDYRQCLKRGLMTRKYSPCCIKSNSDKRLLFAVEKRKEHHKF